jgi:elongation factor 1-alpha
MIYKKDTTLKACQNFNAQVQVLDVPGQLKPGYSPVAFVRCGRSACKMTELIFKVGKETGGKKLESPMALKSNEVAEAVFEPQHPFVVDQFKSCEGLSRIAFLDGNTAVMLGKITKVAFKADK